MTSSIKKIIKETDNLYNEIKKASLTISKKTLKTSAENWVDLYYSGISLLFNNNSSNERKALEFLTKARLNDRLIKKTWLAKLKIILKGLKMYKYKNNERKKPEVDKSNLIFTEAMLNAIKNVDRKIHQLGKEANICWGTRSSWNASGILMRIILERTLDKKSGIIKSKTGLKRKIDYCLSNDIFGKSVGEALGKLNTSTKITGDIIAHDSNILLELDDIDKGIIPLRILIKDVFNI